MTRRRILVVDDDRDFVDILCEIIAIDNHTAEKAYSGPQAVVKITADDFDLVFLDIRLPQFSGIWTLREMRKLHPGIKVVIMTGYSLDEESQKVIDAEGVEVIYKPFEMDKVLNLIKTYTLPDDEENNE